ncbi:MAG: hypothetical protein JWO38_1020 [Gemmataceae bacterium]|nr:hypothetical protein [Gemmataceae bacterium]
MNAVEAGQTVNIAGGTGHDAVTVGNGSLSAIAGPVNVSNTSGTTSLTVNDSQDTAGRAIRVTGSTIDFGGPSPITYASGSVLSNGTRVGVTSVDIFVGASPDTVSASGLSSLTTVFEDSSYYIPALGRSVIYTHRFN